MNQMLFRLRSELPRFDHARLERLVRAGFVSKSQLEDLVRGDSHGVVLLTTLLRVSREDLQSLMGWAEIPAHYGIRLTAPCPLGGVLGADRMPAAVSRLAKLPALATRRPSSHSLVSHYQPPRNQGAVGTCTAFATVSVLEGQLALVDHSEAFIYSLTKAIDGHPESDGSWLRFATAVLAEHGACLESRFPYREDREYLRSKPTNEAREEARKFQSATSTPIVIEPNDIGGIRGAIASDLPVAISVPIYGSSMNSSHFHRTGRFLQRLGDLDRVAGYHAMTIVAYFDDEYLLRNGLPQELGGGCFLVRNSWSPQWASENPLALHCNAGGGYALMSYAYLQYCFEAFTVQVRKRTDQRHHVSEPKRDGWWARTRQAVVAVSRNRIAETVR
jgi:hypothetical protein